MTSFSRMRAYRRDDRTVAVLKIILPRLDGEDTFSKYFNSFYTSIAESYFSSLQRQVDGFCYDGVVRVTVSFEELPPHGVRLKRRERRREDDLICISRTVRVGGIKKTTEIDIFDKRRGVIIR